MRSKVVGLAGGLADTAYCGRAAVGRIEGKVAFVSGGASGLGEAMVQRFTEEGAIVYFGDVNEVNGARVAAANGAVFIQQDVSREEHWVAVMAQSSTTCL